MSHTATFSPLSPELELTTYLTFACWLGPFVEPTTPLACAAHSDGKMHLTPAHSLVVALLAVLAEAAPTPYYYTSHVDELRARGLSEVRELYLSDRLEP